MLEKDEDGSNLFTNLFFFAREFKSFTNFNKTYSLIREVMLPDAR
jgi:hypothetical protein